mmetsp:Transcript_6854/g.6145  ORF Transcript_6854/g.6145 Transcript_6854/m.6145 type:complete len:107 (-) Transcript_6854:533-853(-)
MKTNRKTLKEDQNNPLKVISENFKKIDDELGKLRAVYILSLDVGDIAKKKRKEIEEKEVNRYDTIDRVLPSEISPYFSPYRRGSSFTSFKNMKSFRSMRSNFSIKE